MAAAQEVRPPPSLCLASARVPNDYRAHACARVSVRREDARRAKAEAEARAARVKASTVHTAARIHAYFALSQLFDSDGGEQPAIPRPTLGNAFATAHHRAADIGGLVEAIALFGRG